MVDQIWTWLLVGLLSALFNLTPVLAPPTWAMLGYFHIQQDLPLIPTVLVGAAGATFGRILLALASRKFGARLIPARRMADIDRVTERISNEKRLSIPLLGLFAFGPVPKALLFMAAGIARIPLAPGAIVYFFARAGIYGVALAATNEAAASLGDIVTSPVGGSLMIAAQLASVVGVFLLFRLDLPRVLRAARRSARWALRRPAPVQV